MKYTLGIDVGGTKIASALVEKGLKLTDLKVVSISQTDFVRQLIELFKHQNDFDSFYLQVDKNGQYP